MKKAKYKAYLKDTDRMVELIKRDHGGCEEENCSIAALLNDPESTVEELIHWWACSGAACDEFNKLYSKYEQEITQTIWDGK